MYLRMTKADFENFIVLYFNEIFDEKILVSSEVLDEVTQLMQKRNFQTLIKRKKILMPALNKLQIRKFISRLEKGAEDIGLLI